VSEAKREWLTTATAVDEQRRAWWREIFGCDEIPLKSPIAQWRNVPGFEEAQLCYMLDLKALPGWARARLVVALAARYDISVDRVEFLLDLEGCPVRADGVVMVSSDFSAIMDFIADDWFELDDVISEAHWQDEYDMDDAEDLAMWADYPGEFLESHDVVEDDDD